MAMGRPIITTDANGCRETVIDGENGFLVPIEDSDELSKAMTHFIEKPNLIKEMGQESINYCCDKFEIKKVNKQMLEIISVK
jgi:glycosyltransferase involved in cell wall biosynthesis